MANKILMPSGGQTTDEMIILKWYKNVGDTVNRGDILFEIETDKAILTVESFARGTLLEVKYPEGAMVKTGEVVAVVGDPNEKPIPAAQLKQKVFPAETEKQQNLSLQSQDAISRPDKAFLKKDTERILASPLAKSFARIENIKMEDVAGFVSKKMIRKNDVDLFIKSRQPAIAQSVIETVHFIDQTPMRRTIARRMKESLVTAPHFIVGAEIDMTSTILLRNKLNKNITGGGSKISYNDIIMKVAAKAIESFPAINSSWEGEKIKMHSDVNFGLAIALDAGIMVPVVRQVNKKSISEIATYNSANIEKVKTNTVREPDISGGTITLSNLGMFGIDYFTAIINQPESCILAVGGIIKKVVVDGHEMVIRQMMNITASFDHRTIDGAVGAGFLMKIKAILEDPGLLLF